MKNDSIFYATIKDRGCRNIEYTLPATGDKIYLLAKSEIKIIKYKNGKLDIPTIYDALIYRTNSKYCVREAVLKDKTVEYKRPDEGDQRIYTLSTSELKKIEFANGKEVVIDDKIVVPDTVKCSKNRIGIGLNSSTVFNQQQGETLNFPLGTSLGVGLKFQHFLKDSVFALGVYAGFLQWKSTADILTNAEDSVIGKIKDKMTAIPVMLGATYYRKQVYATIEVGINNLNIKRETTYNGNDQAFIERNSGSDNKTCFAFSIGLGYEYKLNKKNSLNLELLYQRVLYNDPSLNFLGCRILYGIGF